MKNIYKTSFLFLSVAILCFSFGTAVLAQAAPQIETNSATNIQNTSATLNAEINYLGSYNNTSVYFQWGTSTSYGSQTSVFTQNYVGGINQTVYNLTPNSIYHFRVVAQNNYGTVYGQDMTFLTAQYGSNSLTVNAGPDLYLTQGETATLQGSGYDPNGHLLNYYWSCNGGTLSNYNMAQPIYTAPSAYNYNNQTVYTCTLTVTNNYGSSASDSAVVYVNYNNNGNNYGNIYVQTTYATYISNFQATLNGSLSNTNSYATNYVYFQWGATTAYGNETPQQPVGYSQSFMQNIENLNSATTYHFRAVAQGAYGTIYGQDMTFTTSGANASNVPSVPNIPPVSYQPNSTARVLGASTVSTGLTNNFFTDSFFLPLLIIIAGLWFCFSGEIYVFANKLKTLIKK